MGMFHKVSTFIAVATLAAFPAIAQECEDPKIAFIMDDSGSISSSERAAMNASMITITNAIQSNYPSTTVGAVQYGTPNGAGPTGGAYSVAFGYQSVPGAVADLPLNQDHLPDSLDQMMDDGLFSSGALAVPDAVFIFTDAGRISGWCCTVLENDPTSPMFSPDALPGFGEYARLAGQTTTGNVSVFHAAPGVTNQAPQMAQGGGAYVATNSDFAVTEAQAQIIADGLCPPPAVDTPNIETTKTCDAPVRAADGSISAQCQITVTYDSDDLVPTQISIDEDMFVDGSPAQTTITNISSTDDWDCGILPRSGNSDPLNCTWSIGSTPPPPAGNVTSVLNVTLDLSAYGDAGWDDAENCVSAGFYAVPAVSADSGPAVCADLPYPEETPDPEPKQCTPFTPEVVCDAATGDWSVTLNNSLAGGFDPSNIAITSLTSGVTLQSTPGNPLEFNVQGAAPGDTITISTEAVQAGAGGGRGLDLCCMGEMDITIPEGEICEAPIPETPERELEITKVCGPLESPVSNTECVFHVTYSGPAPTPANPIIVTDTLASGGPMNVQSHAPQSGIGAWNCTGIPGGTPVTCEMHNGIDTTAAPGYWDSYSTSFSMQMIATDPYRNCASASILAVDGATISDESCFTVGDFILEIDKQIALEEGGVCSPGAPCTFTYEIANLGTDDYVGPVTLNDTTLVNGTTPGGTVTAISPTLCSDVTDLTNGTGCTGTATIPAGTSQFYQVTYMAPFGLSGAAPHSGQNCVTLTDQGMSPDDAPTETAGKHSCADFTINDPVIEIEKIKVGTCTPETDCEFRIEVRTFGTGYSGRVALFEEMGGFNGIITGMTGAPNPVPASCLPPLNPASCVMDLTLPANATQTYTVSAQHFFGGDGLYDIANCATLVLVPDDTPIGGFDINDPATIPAGFEDITGAGSIVGQSCVALDLEDDPTGGGTGDDTGDLSLSKVCSAVTSASGGPELMMECTITLTGTGLSPGETITIADYIDVPFATTWDVGTVGGFMNVVEPEWTCADVGTPSPGVFPAGTCTTPTDTLINAGGVMTLSTYAVLIGDHGGEASDLNNCVTVAIGSLDASEPVCVPIPVSTPTIPMIVAPDDGPKTDVEKTLSGPCDVDKVGRTYTCDFDLSVSGNGGGDGTIVLRDQFDMAPLSTDATGDGWDCLRSDGHEISCLYSGAKLLPGAKNTLGMRMVLPGLEHGGSFENCASIGISDAKFQRALVIQAILQKRDIDGGPIDGAPGRKTRDGVRQLQRQLGLKPTGDMDPALFGALGIELAGAAKQSCVTVDLPPIPKVCEDGQRIDAVGKCYWPVIVCGRGEIKNSAGECYQPKPRDCRAGQKQNSAGKCYWPRCETGFKRNSKGKCYLVQSRPKCDTRTTVRRGNSCVCKSTGMRQISRTQCRPKGKVGGWSDYDEPDGDGGAGI